jgi:hypothetical protein
MRVGEYVIGKFFCVLTCLTLNKYPLNPIQATWLYVCHINTPHSTLLQYRSSKSRIYESMIHQSAWVSSQDVVVRMPVFLATISATIVTQFPRSGAHASVCFFSIFPFCTFDPKRIFCIHVYSECTETEHRFSATNSGGPCFESWPRAPFSLDVLSFFQIYVEKVH